MNHIYDILDTIKNTLRESKNVNTVTFGQLSDVDLDKTTIFPLSHVILQQSRHLGNIIEHDIKILLSDIVDYNNEETSFDDFYGNDNMQDVLNTQFEVGNRLVSLMRRGDLFNNNYQILSDATFTPFLERFGNVLAGYELDITIQMPNDIKIC